MGQKSGSSSNTKKYSMCNLWKEAHIFYKEGSSEAASWMTDKLNKLLLGKVQELIVELKELLKITVGERKKQLRKMITYLENGKNHIRYDIYLKRGYLIGSGVVEGACKNLVKDRMEQCGMRWAIAGAEAVLGMRSIGNITWPKKNRGFMEISWRVKR